MNIVLRVLLSLTVVSACVAACLGSFSRAKWAGAAEARVGIRAMRVYSGSDGLSHAEKIDTKLGSPNQLGMEQSEELKAKGTNFVRFPATFFEDWHCAHAKRYVITLTGRGEAEVGGGEKVVMEPGTVVLFEDFTGKGHISRALTADWTAAPWNRWNVPIGGGVGKIFRIGSQPMNASLQAFDYPIHTSLGPAWSIRFQLQFLFPR